MASVTDSTTVYTQDFRVGDWWARPALNRLERGEETIQLEPKSMDVLVDLAEHAGDVRSKRRLLHAVWRDAFVSDDVLTHAIWELRRAFADDAKDPRFIRTVPRKGYMLVAEVIWPRPDAPSDERFPYRLGEKLGAGAMGEVYKAEDTRLRRTVALKFLPRELAADHAAKDRFLREARAAAALDHPHIGVVHDLGESPDRRMFIAMAYYRGESLKERLAEGPLPVEEAVELARQIAEGLAAAHGRGIVHRDIKPANVMLSEDSQVKVVDFGLARGAGDTTLTTLGSTVGTALYMSPEQARGDEVDPRSDLWSLGVTLFEMVSGTQPFRGGDIQAVLYAVLNEEPVELSSVASDLPPGLEAVVHRCLEKDPDERYQEASALAEDLSALLAGRRPIAGFGHEKSPYPGLAPFTEETASFFFGREQEVEALWKKVEQRKLLALIGPSGAGKTSFVRAGVIPARPEGWRCLACTPKSDPFVSLGQALAPELARDPEALRELLRFHQPEAAFSMLSSWRRRFPEALIIVDQFEELFTLSPSEVQASFADLLARLAIDGDLHLLLSLRDDFLIHCHDHPALAPVFQELTPLKAPQGPALRQALVEPAATLGYAFEEESLVEEMVNEVEEERGALPLVAFAAARLWEQRDRETGLLTREAYEGIGGVAGALAQHAEATLERIDSERIPVVRELFRNLVTAQGTRAARNREELLSVFEAAGPARPTTETQSDEPRVATDNRNVAEGILDTLIDARLLTSYEVPSAEGPSESSANGQHRIEIIHESLLMNWPRLVRWQTQDTEGAQVRDELRQAAQMWDQHERPEDLLWTGTAFQEFKLWRERYPGRLSELEEDFAHALVTHAERRTRRRRLAIGAALFLALAVTLVTSGLWRRSEASRSQAESEARRAEAAKLLALAQLQLEEDPTEALAYATASLELADTSETRLFILRALAEGPPARVLEPGAPARYPSFSPDGQWIAVGAHSDRVTVWSEEGEGPIILPDHVADYRGANLVLWGPSGYLVTSLWTEDLRRVWSIPKGELVRTIEFGGPPGGPGEFPSPTWAQTGDGHLLGVTHLTDPESETKTLRLRAWPLPEGEPVELGRGDWPSPRDRRSIFDPSGKGWIYSKGDTIFYHPLPTDPASPDRILGRHGADEVRLHQWWRPDGFWSLDSEGEVRLWDTSGPMPRLAKVIPKPEAAGDSILPDSTGRWLSDFADQKVSLWDLRALPTARAFEFRRSDSWPYDGYDFHPDGSWLVTTHGDIRVTFWPLPARSPSVVEGYLWAGGGRRLVAFSPDGQWVATNWPGDKLRNYGSPGELRLWPLPGNQSREVKILMLPVPPYALAFDPASRYVFVAARSRAFVVPLGGGEPYELEGFSADTRIQTTAVSPSGKRAAAAGAWGESQSELRVWDIESGQVQILELPDHGISNLYFADESTLYSPGTHGILRWNLTDGSRERIHERRHEEATFLTFDPHSGSALIGETRSGTACTQPSLWNPESGDLRPLEGHGNCVTKHWRMDLAGGIVATGHRDGTLYVSRTNSSAPHLLVGHEGPILSVAISPDLRWIASSAEDDTLRLWPMPDLDKPPLHSLPLDELLAKLKSLTNLRAVEDPESSTGWSIEIGPFPGWKEVPEW